MIYGYYYICLTERATGSQTKEKPLQISLPGLENHHRYLFNPSHLQWNTNTVTSKNTCDPSWRTNKGNQSDGLSGFTRWFWCGIGPFQPLQPQAEDREAVTKKPESYVLSSQEHQVMQNGFGEQIPSCAWKSHIVKWDTVGHQGKSWSNDVVKLWHKAAWLHQCLR